MKDIKDLKKVEQYIVELGSVISELDNLRRGYYVSPRKIDHRLSKLPIPKVRSVWKKGRKEILELEMGISKREKLRRYISLSVFFRHLSIISISFIGASFALYYANPNKFSFLLKLATSPLIVLLLIIVIPNIYLVLDYLARSYIKEHFSNIRVESRRRLKVVINELLAILIDQMKRYNIKADKIKLKVYHTDYKSIEIVKKPSIFRRYYIIKPKF